ncbi:MAG: V-type ATP synthase subunit F [Thermoprotei archaeon]
MSRLPSKKDIVVIGDLGFINGFKLAGVRRFVEVSETENFAELKKRLGESLARLYEDPSVSLIIVQYKFKDLIADKIQKVGKEPIIVFVPSSKEASKIDVRDYYSRMIKSYLGISIEV